MSPESSGERTEAATPKKRRDARERGQVLKSTEINTAISLLVLFGFLSVVFTTFVARGSDVIAKYLSFGDFATSRTALTSSAVVILFREMVTDFVLMALPVMLVAALTGVIINLAQVGFLFTSKTLMPNFSRISPLQGFKRIFSGRSLAELLKSCIKVTVIAWIVYGDFQNLLGLFPQLMGQSPAAAFLRIMEIAFSLGLKLGLAFIVVAAIDYFYQWRRHENDLKMTKQEVKEEYKMLEGSPEIKGRIRQKQRQISAMRMMQSVPSADVVITNPTHFAVALRYKDKVDRAPVVLAKGADFLAAKIRETAREHDVEIVENKELARAIYFNCDVGQEVAEELYQAVADVLVYVYGLRNKMGKR